jgi:hypothetical protein
LINQEIEKNYQSIEKLVHSYFKVLDHNFLSDGSIEYKILFLKDNKKTFETFVK